VPCPRMSPARARTRTARSGDERTNHEATAAPTVSRGYKAITHSAHAYVFLAFVVSVLSTVKLMRMLVWACVGDLLFGIMSAQCMASTVLRSRKKSIKKRQKKI